MGKDLPERDEHHHFDTQEFAHWFDGTQLLSQSPVEQHQAVHGKLDQVHTEDKLNTDIHHFTITLIVVLSKRNNSTVILPAVTYC